MLPSMLDDKTVRRHSLKLLRDARKRGKKKKVAMQLAAQDLVRLYKKQHGLCALSGRSMLCGDVALRQQDAMSLDRRVPSLGYVESNVQLLTRAVNNAKSTMGVGEFQGMCADVCASKANATHAQTE